MAPARVEHRTGLLRRACAGNTAAVEELFACYQHYLRLLAHTGLSPSVRTRVTVSDVIQETLLHAFESFGQFRGETIGEFVAWIRSILVSRIADAHEKHIAAARRDVRREVSIEAIGASISRSSFGLEQIARDHLQKSPGTLAWQSEQAVLVADAIGRLGSDQRQVIVMRHFDGMSFDQIAERMQRSPGAVRMLWLRAIQKLKDFVSEVSS